MPTTLPFSTTGNPAPDAACVSAEELSDRDFGRYVTGSRSTPRFIALDLATSTLLLAVRFLWMMRCRPLGAMAIASRDSVTVSIAAETSGILS